MLPGCTPARSLMEAPNPLDTVEPLMPATYSHPDPVFDVGDGVFQHVIAGKYLFNMDISLPLMPTASSRSTPRDSCSNLSQCFIGDLGRINIAESRRASLLSAEVTLPGCTPCGSLSESPKPLVTVEPFQPATISHPGPVNETGEGVFQSVTVGKCTFNMNIPRRVTSIDSSCLLSSQQIHDDHLPATGEPQTKTSERLISVYYQNVRGMRTKIVQLRLLLCSCDYDVLVFTETWLRADIDSTEISPDYNFYRCDRSLSTSQHSRGGGVLIAVKVHLNCEPIPLLNCNHLEQIAVRVRIESRSLYLVAIYLPPNSPADHYSAHANAVQGVANSANGADIILSLGDFNLPNLCWHLDEDINGFIPSNVSTEHEQTLIETMFASGLQQVNRYVNANGRLLDLAFVSLPERLDLIEPTAALLPVDIHHVPFILLLDESSDDLTVQRESDDNLYAYDFHSCDFDQLKIALASIDWDSLLRTEPLDETVRAFYEKLYAVLNDYVPRKRRRLISVPRKPWWTSELRHLRNILRKARRRYFFSKFVNDRDNLRVLELQYKTVLLSTYNNYLTRIQASVKQNPSCFWDFVKKQKGSTRIPRNVSFNDVQANSTVDGANLFAIFFESVFSRVSPVPRQECFAHIPSHNIILPVFQFTTDEVIKAIDDLDIKKGPGTDGIPPLLLKNCSKELANPIVHVFNRSLLESTFPAAWKAACIVPIHKSGNCNQVKNYRGVSILCCLSKLFEKLVHNVFYNVASPIIFDGQHGFMKHRSTTTNLMCYVTALSREIEERRQVDAVYVDFAKAFDTVPHILVVEKLKHIGFPDWITAWIYSYLCDRTAYVAVNCARSRTFNITSGVPQGSVLGPLLFNIFINDLCLLFSSFKLSFADDLKLYRVITSLSDCVALQEDINIMLKWCGDNGMRVNDKKCKAISFGRGNSPTLYQYRMETVSLERVSSICDLGVTIDTKLRFNDHVSITTAKAFSVLGFIRRHAAEFTDIHVLKTLYCSLVRSILEYAAPIWSPYQIAHSLTIERVQRKFLRYALRQLPWNDPMNLPPYSDRCKLIGLEPLAARRVTMQRLFIFDVIGGYIDCPELLAQIPLNIPPRRFRNSPLIVVPYHRTNYGYNSPLDSCLRMFNVTSDEFDFNLTKNAFRNRINNS